MSGGYILLFRGVGGATQLPTAPLREALSEAGFSRVATYINSGNALVKTELSREATLGKVAEITRERFDFTKDIHALTLAEWRDLIARNPFPEAAATPNLLHAAVLASAPREENLEAIRSVAIEGEELKVVGDLAYIHTPHGFGRSKMAACFDRKIGVGNTARNWNTVLKLEQLMEKLLA